MREIRHQIVLEDGARQRLPPIAPADETLMDLIARSGTIEQRRLEQGVVEVTFTAAPGVRVR